MNGDGRKEDKIKISALDNPSLSCLQLPSKSVGDKLHDQDLDVAEGETKMNENPRVASLWERI